jgi:hypothetical protein
MWVNTSVRFPFFTQYYLTYIHEYIFMNTLNGLLLQLCQHTCITGQMCELLQCSRPLKLTIHTNMDNKYIACPSDYTICTAVEFLSNITYSIVYKDEVPL